MSVLTTSNRVDYTGDGVAVTFAFSFAVYQKGDIQVWTDDSAMTTNAPEGLVLRTLNGTQPFDYVQTTPNFPGGVKGGSVTFTNAPPINMKVIIIRAVSESQVAEYGNYDKWDAKQAIEQSFDLLAMQVQQMREELNQALTLPVDTLVADPTLPRITSPDFNFIEQIGYNDTGTAIVVRRIPRGVRNYAFNTLSLANLVNFKVPGTYTFVVPSTALYIEMGGASHGGGGGGWNYGNSDTHGARGNRGGDGGYLELLYTAFTVGEILDIVIGTGGAGGAKATAGSSGGFPGGVATRTSISRRAPNAADHLYLPETIATASEQAGGGGYPGEASNVSGGIGDQHTPIGNFAKGTTNFDLFDGTFGYTNFRGNYGGNGGNGKFTVGNREINLGEYTILDFGLIVNPTDGQAGQPGFVAIYY